MRDYALPDGTCRYLVDNRCSIYEKRPTVCNVGEAYKLYFKDVMSEVEYYEMQRRACELLKGNNLEEDDREA